MAGTLAAISLIVTFPAAASVTDLKARAYL